MTQTTLILASHMRACTSAGNAKSGKACENAANLSGVLWADFIPHTTFIPVAAIASIHGRIFGISESLPVITDTTGISLLRSSIIKN